MSSARFNHKRSQYKVAERKVVSAYTSQRFQALQEQSTKVQNPKKLGGVKKKVTFVNMEEEMVVNGSHEPETKANEKILKPRKPKNPVVNLEENNSIVQNGNSESGSVSELIDDNNVENGHVEDSDKNATKQNGNGSLFEENVQDLKEGTPNKKVRRETRAVRELTPKPETPVKRELRRRETTPRASTPKKQSDISSKSHSHKKQNEDLKSQITKNQDIQEKSVEHCDVAEKNDQNKESVLTNEDEASDKSKGNELDTSIIVLNESDKEDIISVNDSVEIIEQDTEKSSGIFSAFRKSFKSYSPSLTKDSIAYSPSSPSVVCLDSPSVDSPRPSTEINARKPINSLSKFPGRTVSITSLDRSIKRKADDSFDGNQQKRFAGEVENGSEKSPGWRFYSSWSPSRLPRSTPLVKRAEEDSMAVNYDENTNLSFADFDTKESSAATATTVPKKWCSIM